MKYMSAKEAAKKWELGERRVQFFCANGKIPNAKRIGNQWIIPADEPRPADGRTRIAKEKKDAAPYHFPIFIFSPLYATQDELDEDEKLLLQAQLLYLEDRRSESMQLCRDVLASTANSAVKIGAYAGIAYNAIVLALHTEYKNALAKIKKMVEAEEKHKEDYRLIYHGLLYHGTWDANCILEIDTSALSRDALLYYTSLNMLLSGIGSSVLTDSVFSLYEVMCRQAEEAGYEPFAMMLHFILAGDANHRDNAAAAFEHTKAGCTIGFRNDWTSYLAKYYFLASSAMDECLKEKGPRYPAKIRAMALRNVNSWRFINLIEYGNAPLEKVDVCDGEFLHLLVMGLTYKQVASSLGISVSTVSRKIQSLCDSLSFRNRNELIAYARAQFEGKMK